jgi:hypothetical protein
MMRRASRVATLAPLLAVAALCLLTPGARGQLKFGIHAARAADVFGGANGAGASLELDVPLFPVDVMVAGDYFRPDCGSASGCSFMGASADLHFALPFPVVQPYGLAGAVVRRSKAGDGSDAESHKGLALGVGLNLRALVVGAYGEARYEFVDPDRQFVFRLGVRF